MHEDISIKYKDRYVIYKLTSPSNKVYIGQSVNLRRRFYAYTNCNFRNKTKLFYSLRKYGFHNFKVDIVFDIKPSKKSVIILNVMEKYFIKKYDCVDNGYNCRTGGENSLHSKESIDKMKAIKSFVSVETRIKMSNALKGKVPSDYDRIKRGNSLKKPILQFSLNGDFIKEWDCSRNIHKELGFDATCISSCCRGKENRKQHRGFVWKFKYKNGKNNKNNL